MKKITLQVPREIRYVGEWPGFRLEDFPYILNKGIPGCGLAEYCVTNSEDMIFCSPMKEILDSKALQRGRDVFYADEGSIKLLPEYIREVRSVSEPCKILVSHDSFYLVKAILGKERISSFRVIIDELQVALNNNELLKQVKDLRKICYVLCTPIEEELLPDLPYYELDWSAQEGGK